MVDVYRLIILDVGKPGSNIKVLLRKYPKIVMKNFALT